MTANVYVIGFKMNSVNSKFAAEADGKLDGALANSLRAIVWLNIKLVD